MKTFKNFILEAPTEAQAAQMAPDMAPEKRRAALEKNARRQAAKDTPVNKPKPQAALPPGKTGGELAKKGIDVTKQQRTNNSSSLAQTNKTSSGDGTRREAIGAPKPKGGGNKTYERINPPKTHKKGGPIEPADAAKKRALDKMKADAAAKKKEEDRKKREAERNERTKAVLKFGKDALNSNKDDNTPGTPSTGAPISGPDRRTKANY